jgi:hypothetical protein
LTQLTHLNSCQPRSFGLVQHYPPLKSRTVTLGGVHFTHQPRSSIDSSIRHALVIEFTFTLLKPVGDPKPAGCGRRCNFSPVSVTADGFERMPRVWAGFAKPAPLPSLIGSSQARKIKIICNVQMITTYGYDCRYRGNTSGAL